MKKYKNIYVIKSMKNMYDRVFQKYYEKSINKIYMKKIQQKYDNNIKVNEQINNNLFIEHSGEH